MQKKDEKANAVNEALKLPLAEEFEQDLAKLLQDGETVESVTIAAMDLDDFLLVNNRCGRSEGDAVLIAAGRYFLAHLPAGAKLYRYAGDMFCILFAAGTEKEEAFLLMEQLRKAYPVETHDHVKQTVTIGIASAPEDGSRPTELLTKADGALYRGKVNGRDRVCLAREEKMVTKTSHYTVDQLQRLTKLSKREGVGEAVLLREALNALLKKYEV
ncbi:MAG: diguanylate cyclase [Clostridiaceae bacterium]